MEKLYLVKTLRILLLKHLPVTHLEPIQLVRSAKKYSAICERSTLIHSIPKDALILKLLQPSLFASEGGTDYQASVTIFRNFEKFLKHLG